MRLERQAEVDKATLLIADSASGDRVRVLPWLSVVIEGEQLQALEIESASRHLPSVDLREQLCGVREAAELFGVRRSNFLRDIASQPDFPAPIASLASSRIWRRADLMAYRARQPAREGASFDTDAARRKARRVPRRTKERVMRALSGLALSDDARTYLPAMIERIVALFHPERIILFGSQAAGRARADSDVDLLVVFPKVEDQFETHVAIRRALVEFPIARDIVVSTPAELDRWGQVAGELLNRALDEGVVVYDRAA